MLEHRSIKTCMFCLLNTVSSSKNNGKHLWVGMNEWIFQVCKARKDFNAISKSLVQIQCWVTSEFTCHYSH